MLKAEDGEAGAIPLSTLYSRLNPCLRAVCAHDIRGSCVGLAVRPRSFGCRGVGAVSTQLLSQQSGVRVRLQWMHGPALTAGFVVVV